MRLFSLCGAWGAPTAVSQTILCTTLSQHQCCQWSECVVVVKSKRTAALLRRWRDLLGSESVKITAALRSHWHWRNRHIARWAATRHDGGLVKRERGVCGDSNEYWSCKLCLLIKTPRSPTPPCLSGETTQCWSIDLWITYKTKSIICSCVQCILTTKCWNW